MNKHKNGTTLLEVVVALVISSILLTAITSLFIRLTRESVLGTSHLSNMQQGVLLCNLIEFDLQRAEEVIVDESGFSIKIIEDVGVNGGAIAKNSVGVSYIENDDTITRVVSSGFSHEHGEGVRVKKVNNTNMLQWHGDKCILINFIVASRKDEEPHEIKKLVFCSNLKKSAVIPDYTL